MNDQTPQGESSTPNKTTAPLFSTPVPPAELTEVTHFSKAFAMGLFILLPFVGFMLGVLYATGTNDASVDVPPVVTEPEGPNEVVVPTDGVSAGGSDASGTVPATNDVDSPTPATTTVASDECGVTNCHGYEISCGDVSEPIACTMEYRVGDGCRQFASCEIAQGTCAPVLSARFEECKTCAQACESANAENPIDVLACESKCYDAQ